MRTSVTASVTNNYTSADGCDRKHTFQQQAFSYFSSSQLTVLYITFGGQGYFPTMYCAPAGFDKLIFGAAHNAAKD